MNSWLSFFLTTSLKESIRSTKQCVSDYLAQNSVELLAPEAVFEALANAGPFTCDD